MTASFTPMTTADFQAVTLLWFHFRQNNSGGYFIENEIVCEDVFIQARNAKEAKDKAGDLFAPYSEFCSCCGERWSFWIDDDDGKPVPMVYNRRVEDTEPNMFRKKARLHYFDGHVETFTYGQQRQGVISE